MTAARRLFALGCVGLSVLASGCVSGSALRARAAGVREHLDQIRKPAMKCAERELAMAEAHLEFAVVELDQGAFLRARDHMETVVDFARKADVNSRAPGCREVPDHDKDGIPDDVDLCPNQREDFDGFEDEDGCPEDQDTDGDGVPDSRDQCPNDPEDFDGDEDEDGCPDRELDRDGDGVPDATDQCPDEAEDKDGFEDDNGCPDPDNDNDGIGDQDDRCPLQPEDRDEFEDDDGCPDPDNDADRVPDAVDRCPNEPEDYDGDADEDGCPDLYKAIVVTNDRIELKQTIFFATGKDRILPKSYPLLNEVALALRDLATLKVRIEGHTDSRGSARYNERLSQKRAESVRRYLVGQGVGGDRMVSIGYGEDRPIEDNRTAEGRAANRRVEFHITAK